VDRRLHWARSVEITGAGDGVENRAGLVVREVFEGFFVMRFGKEDAGLQVAREACRDEAFA
jgi:hypothetical protein